MTLAQFPVFGFFFQDSRIGVKDVGYSKSWDLKNVESYGSRNESKSGIK